jgi:hypothetical protein
VLPFRKKTMPVQCPKFGVPQPDRGDICIAVASAGDQFEGHHAVFAAVTLRPFHAQLVKTFQVVLGHGRYGRAFLCLLDEGSE